MHVILLVVTVFCKSRRTVPLNTPSTAGHSSERVRVKDGGYSAWLRLRGETLNFYVYNFWYGIKFWKTNSIRTLFVVSFLK
jgi:CYTH domain-containing protein